MAAQARPDHDGVMLDHVRDEPASNGQFEAIPTITNTTGAPVPQWTVVFSAQSISSAQTGQAAQQVVANGAVVHVSQQGQMVTVASGSILDAGASATPALHWRQTGPPGGMPGAFTLNGRRCDAPSSSPRPHQPRTRQPRT